jgi:hypothetical protein
VPVCAVALADHCVSAWLTLATARCCACSVRSTVVAAAALVAFRR